MVTVLKYVGTFALMVAGGLLAILMAASFLMNLGLKLHDNYEYYRTPLHVAFMIACGILGFAAPGWVIWWLNTKRRFSLRALLVAFTVVSLLLEVYIWSF